jgi:hypothetical protein
MRRLMGADVHRFNDLRSDKLIVKDVDCVLYLIVCSDFVVVIKYVH